MSQAKTEPLMKMVPRKPLKQDVSLRTIEAAAKQLKN